tara:strand:+ start:636 stop:788 length:153 start_codon:yes stop_codon:yes gene_type:complete
MRLEITEDSTPEEKQRVWAIMKKDYTEIAEAVILFTETFGKPKKVEINDD